MTTDDKVITETYIKAKKIGTKTVKGSSTQGLWTVKLFEIAIKTTQRTIKIIPKKCFKLSLSLYKKKNTIATVNDVRQYQTSSDYTNYTYLLKPQSRFIVKLRIFFYPKFSFIFITLTCKIHLQEYRSCHQAKKFGKGYRARVISHSNPICYKVIMNGKSKST
ncbi:UNKNOWN [Stylonychia lemnae]|uniref:Uncharacterized protein n=1 Tax=Stylonychia lemnae TaxID=5949 RepID=A0A077ZXW2_STYLE|nr:UNKNOWN [Stylonychia lemnae]|eukprot:CDW73371.1 UNKNOWN [Stylonychia lemnae]